MVSGESVEEMRLKQSTMRLKSSTTMPQVSQMMALKLLLFMRSKAPCFCLRHPNLIGCMEIRILHL